MAEDLSAYLDYSPDGTPRVKPGLGALPPMNRTPPPDAARQGGKATGKNATSGEATSGKADDPKRKAAAGRFGILNAFVDCSLAELSRSEIAVWLVLYRDTRDGTVRTSQSNVARRSGLSVRAVRYAVQNLLKTGLLTVVFQGGLNRGATRYRVEPLRKRASSVLRQNNVSD